LKLTRRAFDLAREHQVRNIYLLTETAKTYYPFQSYNDIAVFNGNGDKIPHDVIPDRQREGDYLFH
jgi:hypothetical protein